MAKKTVFVVLVPTDKKTTILKQTINHRGERIFNDKSVLEYSENETYLRNVALMNSGKASTSSEARYQFFDMMLTMGDNQDIKMSYEDNWYYNTMNGHITGQPYAISTSDNNVYQKIIVSDTKHICNDIKIPKDFKKYFVEMHNKGIIIDKIDIEITPERDIAIMPNGTAILTAVKMYTQEEVDAILEDYKRSIGKIEPKEEPMPKKDLIKFYPEMNVWYWT